MRFSLPLRIFLVHLAFTVGAAGLAVFLVRDSFQRYKERWERELETLPGEALFQPLANEIARSLLLRLEGAVAEEVEDRDREQISEGLQLVLRELPSIRSVVIVDRDGRIQYASETQAIDLGYTGAQDTSLLAAGATVRLERVDWDGVRVTEVRVPVYDNPGGGDAAAPRRRLGSVIVRYAPDPALTARIPALEPPSIGTRDFVLPVVLFLATVAVSGVLIAVLTGLPVRRLDRAMRDFRARGFRGGLAIDRRELRGGLADAINAINEMGGRLEALDAQGREREALLATLAQSLEEGMVTVDPGGRPVAWNPAAVRMMTTQEEGGGGTAEPGEARALLARVLQLNPELGGPAPDAAAGRKRELELLLTDGTRIPVRVTRLPFEIAPKQQGVLLLLRDLATLRKIESHLLEAGRFAGLAHLAAGLAHEIRNPLHAIGLNAGVVEQYVGREPSERARAAMRESLASIKDETRRLTDLLNNYLGLVRADRTAEPVDIRELCERVQRLLAYVASQARVEIRLEGHGNLPPVEGVSSRLQQAILNLVLNSIQAMPDGGVVTLATTQVGGFVELTVADTGPGLPADLEHHLFEVRMTTKPEGTGLGLPLVSMITRAHGGEVAYRRRPGGGTAMILRLPVRAAA